MDEEKYDASWDEDGDPEPYERKRKEWEGRDWVSWLQSKLTFPFRARREEDMHEDFFFEDEADRGGPFAVGRKVDVLGFAEEGFDLEVDGVIAKVRSGKRRGCLPLQELEVKPKSDPNHWPVREFVVWYANI